MRTNLQAIMFKRIIRVDCHRKSHRAKGTISSSSYETRDKERALNHLCTAVHSSQRL